MAKPKYGFETLNVGDVMTIEVTGNRISPQAMRNRLSVAISYFKRKNPDTDFRSKLTENTITITRLK